MSVGAYIASKDALKTFILERLGYPQINIEVTDIQVQHCINETLDKWVTHATGGTQYRFGLLATTAGTQTYQMGFDVEAITWIYDVNDVDLGAVFPAGSYTTTSFTGTANFVTGVVGGQGKHDLLSIELTRNHLATIEHLLSEKVEFDFNSSTRELYLMEPFTENLTVGYTYYQRVDYSDESSFLYDQTWIKRYSTALTKKQWAGNLSKYNGIGLPAGLQIDPQSILSEANTEIEKLDEELIQVWEPPVEFFVG